MVFFSFYCLLPLPASASSDFLFVLPRAPAFNHFQSAPAFPNTKINKIQRKIQRLPLPCPSCQMGGQRTPPWPETREVEEKRARGSKRRNILRLGLLIAGRGRFGDSSYCQTSTRVNIVQVSRSRVRYKGGVVCPFCHHWIRCGPITWVELSFFFTWDTWWSFYCSPFLYVRKHFLHLVSLCDWKNLWQFPWEEEKRDSSSNLLRLWMECSPHIISSGSLKGIWFSVPNIFWHSPLSVLMVSKAMAPDKRRTRQ